MAKSKEFQSYNSRNKKWVHFKSGKIVKTSDNKLKGVPVRTSAKKNKQACSAAGSRLRACANPSGSGKKKRKATGGKNPWWPYS